MKNNDYTINYKNGIITIGASFAERAGKIIQDTVFNVTVLQYIAYYAMGNILHCRYNGRSLTLSYRTINRG